MAFTRQSIVCSDQKEDHVSGIREGFSMHHSMLLELAA